jgi:hypothetical protein
MPRVTIWIREKDFATWQAIDDKPKWLHKHLNQIKAEYSVTTEQTRLGTSSTIYPKSLFDNEPTVTPPEETA